MKREILQNLFYRYLSKVLNLNAKAADTPSVSTAFLLEKWVLKPLNHSIVISTIDDTLDSSSIQATSRKCAIHQYPLGQIPIIFFNLL